MPNKLGNGLNMVCKRVDRAEMLRKWGNQRRDSPEPWESLPGTAPQMSAGGVMLGFWSGQEVGVPGISPAKQLFMFPQQFTLSAQILTDPWALRAIPLKVNPPEKE